MNKIYQQLGILANRHDNNLVNNLTEVPKKEKNYATPHTTANVKYATMQADLLFLPEDDGYKYLLVVVDVATRLTDAEPLKNKEAKTVCNATKKIFRRKILQTPLRLEVDAGTEFKGDFKS